MRVNLIGLIVVLVGISTFLPKLAEIEYLEGSIDPYRAGILVLCGLLAMAEGFVLMIQKHREKLEKKVSHDRLAIQEQKISKLEGDAQKLESENSQAKKKIDDLNSSLAAKDEASKAKEKQFQDELQKVQVEINKYKTAFAESEAKQKEMANQITKASEVANTGEDQVVKFLSLLQKKGRLLDFLMDEISQRPDAQVGAVARIVHQGCLSVLQDFFQIIPLRNEAEGSAVEVPKDYSSQEISLVGNVSKDLPEKGTILHRGWMTKKVDLPQVIDKDLGVPERRVIAPAEIQM